MDVEEERAEVEGSSFSIDLADFTLSPFDTNSSTSNPIIVPATIINMNV